MRCKKTCAKTIDAGFDCYLVENSIWKVTFILFLLLDAMVLWDAIFADNATKQIQDDKGFPLLDLSLVEHISIFMLVYVRSQCTYKNTDHYNTCSIKFGLYGLLTVIIRYCNNY